MQFKKILMLSLLSITSLTMVNAQEKTKGCVEGNCENGWGIYEYYVGSVYQGKYVGYFETGKRVGKGKFIYANGDKYEGNWIDGRPDGFGAKITKAGKVKSGIWDKGKFIKKIKKDYEVDCLVGSCKEGYGKAKDSRGHIYSGEFKKGLYHGFGEMKYANGNRYKGHWAQGAPHGQGSLYNTNGHVQTGEFVEGKFIDTKMKVWAVIVGIADYQNFHKLNYTRNDAQRVYAFLRSVEGGAVPEEQIKLLLDEEATGINIANTAADLFLEADSTDLIMFYFAGHGKNNALLPYDYDGNPGKDLPHAVVNSCLKDSPAKFKICLIDACHSGSFDIDEFVSFEEYKEQYEATGSEAIASNTRSGKSVRDKIKDYYKSFKDIKKGSAVIMSSAAEEISLEANKLKQGVFSYYFIQALKGAANQEDENGDKDNIIDVNEIYQFIDKNVRNFTYGYQHPMIYGEYDDKMPVGILHK